MKLVSVYIPTHNRAFLLKRAIDSVLNQTYKNIELIIVNDCSNDDTFEYLEKIKSNKIIVHHNQEGKGACYCRNLAINISSGEYITGLDDDDYFYPDRIQNFINQSFLLDSQVVGLFDDHSTLKNRRGKVQHSNKIEKVFIQDLSKKNEIGNQVFLRKDNIDGELFDSSFSAWQDWDAWLTLLKNNKNKNKFFKNISRFTYCVDKSHPHERISEMNIDRIIKAYHLFVEKHSDCVNKETVKLELINYKSYKIKISDLFLILKNKRFFLLMKKIIGYF